MSRTITISPTQPPPVGLMGGSLHRWVRGRDPFAREFMPDHLKDRFPDRPAASGWLAEDYWGNEIGWSSDGSTLEVADDADFTPVPRPDPAKEGGS